MKEGTLYPILHALEKGKYLSSYQQEAPTGRVRKYYHVTAGDWSSCLRKRRSGSSSPTG